MVSRPPRERPLAIARLALARDSATESRAVSAPRYLKALERALADELPPFATEVYAELFRAAAQSGQWLVIWLMHAAEDEGQRARRLWSQAAAHGDGEASLLKRHAVDKSNHVLAYLKLIDVVFPGAVPAALRAELELLSPHYTMSQEVIAAEADDDDGAAALDVAGWIRANLSELRTAVRHVLLGDAISSHCAEDRAARAAPMLRSLLGDEVRHIGDSAQIIESRLHAEDEKAVTAALLRGMREHVRATSEDAVDYTYNVRFGNYP
jgi:hypothetical protein